MAKQTEVVIIGAGPFGLSLAAHLKKKQVDFRIFGKPMGTWRDHMPSGMCLKSEGFASNLYHPDGEHSLQEFCKSQGIDYSDIGTPVKLSTFASYGMAFQEKVVPELETSLVANVSRDGEGFSLVLENGEKVAARRVVVAAGITHFSYLPPVLADLPKRFVSHSSTHHALDHLKDRDVVVVGAGSSAIDVAVALHQAGAKTQLVTRRAQVAFHGKAPDKRSLLARLRAPWSGLGPSWRSRIACDLPLLYHVMPLKFRSKVVRKHLGPSAGWFTREIMQNHVPMHVGVTLVGAYVQDEKVHLQLLDGENKKSEIVADHLVAGTGYQVNIRRLPFMSDALCDQVELEESSPKLTSHFESSVRGLYFMGTSAALSFGPLLRFAFGAGFACNRVARHIAGRAPKKARVRSAAPESRATSGQNASATF